MSCTRCVGNTGSSTTDTSLAGYVHYASAFLVPHDRNHLAHKHHRRCEIDCNAFVSHHIRYDIDTGTVIQDPWNVEQTVDSSSKFVNTGRDSLLRNLIIGEFPLKEAKTRVLFK